MDDEPRIQEGLDKSFAHRRPEPTTPPPPASDRTPVKDKVIENMANRTEVIFAEVTLKMLKSYRERLPMDSDIRHYYNQVCRHLDVLHSKLTHG